MFSPEGYSEVGCVVPHSTAQVTVPEITSSLQKRGSEYSQLLHVGLAYLIARDASPSEVRTAVVAPGIYSVNLGGIYDLRIRRSAVGGKAELFEIRCTNQTPAPKYPPATVTLPPGFLSLAAWLEMLNRGAGPKWSFGEPGAGLASDAVLAGIAPDGLVVEDINKRRPQHWSPAAIEKALAERSDLYQRLLHVGWLLNRYLTKTALAASLFYGDTESGEVLVAGADYRLEFIGWGKDARLAKIVYLMRVDDR